MVLDALFPFPCSIDIYPNSDYNTGCRLERKGMPMGSRITGPLALFNQLYKQMDETYHSYAKKLVISATALWLLYSLYESSGSYTQRELCSLWHYPPQTVNSVLKGLEKQGILYLAPIPGNQKNKQIVLTEKGKAFTENRIAPLVSAEQKAFQGLTGTEREALLALTRKYAGLLQAEINKI